MTEPLPDTLTESAPAPSDSPPSATPSATPSDHLECGQADFGPEFHLSPLDGYPTIPEDAAAAETQAEEAVARSAFGAPLEAPPTQSNLWNQPIEPPKKRKEPKKRQTRTAKTRRTPREKGEQGKGEAARNIHQLHCLIGKEALQALDYLVETCLTTEDRPEFLRPLLLRLAHQVKKNEGKPFFPEQISFCPEE